MTGELRAKANELKQRVADKVERITQKEARSRSSHTGRVDMHVTSRVSAAVGHSQAAVA